MAIVRWDPFRELSSMQQEMNRLFDETLRRSEPSTGSITGAWVPAVDIIEREDAVLIQAELPGMTREEVLVSVEGSTLTFSGERRHDDSIRQENYHRIERSYGTFSRSFSLPNTIDPEQISAKMQDGILELVLPKRDESKPRQIQVNVD